MTEKLCRCSRHETQWLQTVTISSLALCHLWCLRAGYGWGSKLWMGRSSSKFSKLIRNGDEDAAVQLLVSNAELHKALDPSAVYKGSQDGDTPLHCVCRQRM